MQGHLHKANQYNKKTRRFDFVANALHLPLKRGAFSHLIKK